MSGIAHHIQERFPDKKEAIAGLMAEDAEFCTICEDYGVCVEAYRYWMRAEGPEAGARVIEYRDLIKALEAEIEATLVGQQAEQAD